MIDAPAADRQQARPRPPGRSERRPRRPGGFRRTKAARDCISGGLCSLQFQQEDSRRAVPCKRRRHVTGSLRLGVLHQELTHEFLLFLVQPRAGEHALRDALPLARRELCRIARAVADRAALIEDLLAWRHRCHGFLAQCRRTLAALT